MRRPVPVPCCIEAPPDYVPKARYALEMLLQPLGIDPTWTPRADLHAGIYYGPHPEGLPEEVVAFPLEPETVAFFEERRPVHAEDIQHVTWDGEAWPVPVGTTQPDLIGAAFFWLSGWQEHVQPRRDVHGRFPFEVSLQAELGSAARPPVDAYREILAERLRAAGLPVARRRWGEADWAFCPTHDIDYLRKWRPGIVYRELVPYFLRNQRSEPFGQRARRLAASVREAILPGDPHRSAFERMHDEVARRGGTATYFLKMAAHGSHDVYYDPQDRYLTERVEALRTSGFEVGLHPSYYAHTHPGYLETERDRLAALTGGPPRSVRQHYLRYVAPITPRQQAAAGFRVDSTLGFSTHEGFRHGTCLPFRVFDVEANAPLDLWEMPLAMMESALFNRRQLTLEAAVETARQILETCRRFGGAAVMLWHNVLWDEHDHPGWGAHFLATLDVAGREGGRICSLREALDRWDPRVLATA